MSIFCRTERSLHEVVWHRTRLRELETGGVSSWHFRTNIIDVANLEKRLENICDSLTFMSCTQQRGLDHTAEVDLRMPAGYTTPPEYLTAPPRLAHAKCATRVWPHPRGCRGDRPLSRYSALHFPFDNFMDSLPFARQLSSVFGAPWLGADGAHCTHHCDWTRAWRPLPCLNR